jgi:UDP:flavonoid glycosyltransferase YjiC (YdhE family)
MLKVIKETFRGTDHEVFLASSYLKEETVGNIHVAPRWDFDTLLDEAVLFINHGGQNSMVDGLLHGVPQIVVPGKIFERRYNAEKLAENNAGRWIESNDFTPEKILNVTGEVIGSEEMRKNARILGNKLMNAGGIDRIIESMQL